MNANGFPSTATALAAIVLTTFSAPAYAHFPWLVSRAVSGQTSRVECFFAEAPEAEEAELLKYVNDTPVTRYFGRSDTEVLTMQPQDAALVADLDSSASESIVGLQKELGVMTRGDASFLVRYAAIAGPNPGSRLWNRKDLAEATKLFAELSVDAGVLTVTVTFDGKAAAAAEVVPYHEARDHDALIANAQGEISIPLSGNPLVGLRLKHVTQTPGTVGEKSYSEVRYYTTLTFPPQWHAPVTADASLAPLPETVTSFGAAIDGNAVYVYGGHTGSAHHYTKDDHAHTLRALTLEPGAQWRELGDGPPVQGLALVASEGKLYRIGGFSARNAEGEDHDLWSQASVDCYDVASGIWSPMPALPEPRSSFDAAVLGRHLYVVGGWSMQGEAEEVWHATAWRCNLDQPAAGWEAIAAPPFQRRALTVAAVGEHLYAIGGMQAAGSTTTASAVYLPAQNRWQEGPALQGESMNGFGASAFAVQDRLFVSTYDGSLQVLSADGSQFEVVGHLPQARFFHRMLAIPGERLLILGGASMSEGKFESLEVIETNELPLATAQP